VAAVIAALATVITLLSAAPVAAQGSTAVFVNEIHYDTVGTDSGEAIEVAGSAGTDLTGSTSTVST
jgi:uncharacterized protein